MLLIAAFKMHQTLLTCSTNTLCLCCSATVSTSTSEKPRWDQDLQQCLIWAGDVSGLSSSALGMLEPRAAASQQGPHETQINSVRAKKWGFLPPKGGPQAHRFWGGLSTVGLGIPGMSPGISWTREFSAFRDWTPSQGNSGLPRLRLSQFSVSLPVPDL